MNVRANGWRRRHFWRPAAEIFLFAPAATARLLCRRPAIRAGAAHNTRGVRWLSPHRDMDRFLSNAVNRIDAKGRVSVPAHFRSVVQKRGYSELYALRALDVPAMDVGGLDLLDRYEQRIAREDPFLGNADDMSFFVHGDGTFVKIDQDGRITMSDFIRAHTGITTEVAFVGRGAFFQIWEPGRLEAHGKDVRERLLSLRQAQRAIGFGAAE
jgi:MraZ protein